MKTSVKVRPLDIQVEDGDVYLSQTDSGAFYVRIGKAGGSNCILADRKQLESLIRAAIWMKNEVDGKNK